MKARVLILVMVIGLFGNFMVACSKDSNITGMEPGQSAESSFSTIRPGHGGGVIINPVPYNTLVFDFDETAPASSTLRKYPNVDSWRLILDARISHQAMYNGDIKQLTNKATIMGYDARGNKIASGTAYVGNPDKQDTWYCTIEVEGKALDMAQAGKLLTAILDDIEVGGDGNPFDKANSEDGEKVACWILAIGAAAGVVGSVVEGAAVLAACFGTGGAGCAAAIAAYIAVGGGGLVLITTWYCQCVDETASFC